MCDGKKVVIGWINRSQINKVQQSIFYFWFNRSENKSKEKVDRKQIYEKEDPGAVGFTSGFSRER